MFQIHPSDERPAEVDPAIDVAKKLSKTMLSTVVERGLLREGDRILVGLSGGKDSTTLFDLLSRARRKSPVSFELFGFHLDQGQPGHDVKPLRDWLEGHGEPFEIALEDTYSVVMEDARDQEKPTYCRLCSRLRRGILYTAAERHGCNKIALGHHREDSLETFLLNLFYAGKLQAMPAGYETNDGRFDVIRPLIECSEEWILEHARREAYPILPCNLCGSQDDLKRVAVGELLSKLEQDIPNLRQVMMAALKNVRPTHLMDAEVAEAWTSQADRYPPRR